MIDVPRPNPLALALCAYLGLDANQITTNGIRVDFGLGEVVELTWDGHAVLPIETFRTILQAVDLSEFK